MLAAVGKGGTDLVSMGTETDVQHPFDSLQRVAGTDVEPELAPLHEAGLERSWMDPSWALRELGWRGQVALEDGLRNP